MRLPGVTPPIWLRCELAIRIPAGRTAWPAGSVGNRIRPVHVGADEIAQDLVVVRLVDNDAVAVVARDDVPRRFGRASDQRLAGAVCHGNTVIRVAQVHRSLDVGADVVALDHVLGAASDTNAIQEVGGNSVARTGFATPKDVAGTGIHVDPILRSSPWRFQRHPSRCSCPRQCYRCHQCAHRSDGCPQ